MPTMPERMATVETTLGVVKADVSEIKADVKLLLTEKNREDGARQQRLSTNKKLVALVTIAATALTGVISFLSDYFANVVNAAGRH